MLYLMFEPDVAEYYRSFSRIGDIPLTGLGLASSVLAVGRLADALRDSISPALRRARWESARRIAGAPEDSAAVAVEFILKELS